MRVTALLFGFVALLLAACSTSTNLLNEGEIAGLRIERVDVSYKPDAVIWWGKPEREYVEQELARRAAKPGAPKKRAPSVTDASDTGQNAVSAEYNQIADSPEAKAYIRDSLVKLVKQRIDKEIVPEFKGSRPVVLEITIVGFLIPSAAQRVVLGGTPTFGALRVLKDARSGAELARLDQMSAAGAGQGILGVAIEQAMPDLEDRLLAVFVTQTKNWLLKR